MAILFMIGMVIVIIVVDIAIRITLWKWREHRERQERQQALDIGLRLDFTDEAPSLKRVQLEHPQARILAVDDEPVVLDSFRKILVYANYEIETVETGKEAVGLVQKNDYEFVFTDLKMPEMDGLEVLKAVKHFRPDIDVIMITGYATIESAVEAMKHGGMDYVQKPFTEDELVEFVNKCLIRRQDRIEREKPPTLRLVTPSEMELGGRNVYNIPAGVFISQGHTWVSIETNGLARVGIDDFINKIIGPIDGIELPKIGQKVLSGNPLISLVQKPNVLSVLSPVSGTVRRVNTNILERIELLKMKPYELGWMCCIEPTNLSEDLRSLRIGADAMSWYEGELRQFREIAHEIEEHRGKAGDRAEESDLGQGRIDPETWALIAKTFMKGGKGPPGSKRPH
jgi:CheY-like chemotaxis protein